MKNGTVGDGAGLTKRELLAGMAMQGFLSNFKILELANKNPDSVLRTVSLAAIEHADDLISQLDKSKK